jgi:predicted phosphoadenosine phosphosulfate sulfurtransferase
MDLDQKLKQSGHTWQSYSKLLGENPSNFKRKLLQNIDKINNWLEPLNLQIQVVPKVESGEKKIKEKD